MKNAGGIIVKNPKAAKAGPAISMSTSSKLAYIHGPASVKAKMDMNAIARTATTVVKRKTVRHEWASSTKTNTI